MLTTSITVILVEFCARIATSSRWTHHIWERYPSKEVVDVHQGIYLTAWLPPTPYFIFGMIFLIVCHCSVEYCIIKRSKDRSKDRYIHIILPVSFNVFGSIYSLFPAIIQVLAYPTQMIALLTFALAYVFATTIFSAIIYKISEQCFESTKKVFLCFAALIIPTWIISSYLLIIANLFLYIILIGRGSAITTGPLFVISLLPSLLLSVIAWIAKRVSLNEMDKNKDQ